MYYFAYGINLNKEEMRQLCPDCQPRFTATLPNYKLIFTGWSRKWRGGVASIRPFRDERVPGAIYELSDADLRRLDKNEGYPAEYDRRNINVFDEDGEQVAAVTYIKLRQSDTTPPSREYLALIRQGYREWGIV